MWVCEISNYFVTSHDKVVIGSEWYYNSSTCEHIYIGLWRHVPIGSASITHLLHTYHELCSVSFLFLLLMMVLASLCWKTQKNNRLEADVECSLFCWWSRWCYRRTWKDKNKQNLKNKNEYVVVNVPFHIPIFQSIFSLGGLLLL